MCTHSKCFSKKKKNIKTFHLKINIFTALKYCCILHGRVCVIKDANQLRLLFSLRQFIYTRLPGCCPCRTETPK